jgi:hypothetical protein
MKRLLALTFGAMLALPAVAEETKTTEKTAPKAETAKAAPQPAEKAPANESPLAAAARRTGRVKSKTPVITDDMVKKSDGRLSTTDSDYTPPPLPAEIQPDAEVVAREQREKAKAAAEKQAAEKKAAEEKENLRKARLAEMAEQLEDGYPDDQDPAAVEAELAKAGEEEKKQEEKKP